MSLFAEKFNNQRFAMTFFDIKFKLMTDQHIVYSRFMFRGTVSLHQKNVREHLTREFLLQPNWHN